MSRRLDNRQQGDDSNVEVARIAAKYDFWKRIWWPPTIAALWFPIRASEPIAEALAGKETDVTVAVSISIAITIAVSLGAAALLKKIRDQADELKRLRERCNRLEGELTALKGRQIP